MSLEVGLKKIRLIHLEDFLVLLLGLDDPGLRWMFSEPDPESFTVPSATGSTNFHYGVTASCDEDVEM